MDVSLHPNKEAKQRSDATSEVLSRRKLLTSGAAVLGALGLTAGAAAQAPPAFAAGSGWTPIQFRSVDSRTWSFKPVKGDQFQLDLTDDQYGNWIITTSAVAVSYNLTATATEGSGYLSLWKYGATWPGTSSVNWRQDGLDIANGGIVELGSAYYASIMVGGNNSAATDFIVDITGYFS